jgi:hypothetical protein
MRKMLIKSAYFEVPINNKETGISFLSYTRFEKFYYLILLKTSYLTITRRCVEVSLPDVTFIK